MAFVASRGSGLSIDASHASAAAAATAVQPQPGSAEFEATSSELRASSISEGGALFLDKSNMYHYEGSYNFEDEIDFVDLVAGGNVRNFNINSEATLFALDDNGDEISYWEYGAYVQAKKSFHK